MSIDLSPQNEQYLDQIVASGAFSNRDQALDHAVELLRRRQELMDHIDEGTRQLRAGEGIEVHGVDDLKALLGRDDLEGIERCRRIKDA